MQTCIPRRRLTGLQHKPPKRSANSPAYLIVSKGVFASRCRLPNHSLLTTTPRGGRPSQRAGRRMVVTQEKVAKGIHQEAWERRGGILGLWRARTTGLRQISPRP